MELSIAKEQYEFSDQVRKKLDYLKWVNYIEERKNYYHWLEETEKGKERLMNINKIPENFRKGILEQLNKTQVYTEYNIEKGWFEIILDFDRSLGVLKTTFMKKVTKKHLYELLEMANYLDALLLNNGTEVIDEKIIERMK